MKSTRTHFIRTNIFLITNTEALRGNYRFCRVLGLRRDHPEYFRNKDALRGLARRIRRPVVVTERRGELYLAIPADVTMLPADFSLTGAVAQFEMGDEIFDLNFSSPTDEERPIVIEFLRSALDMRLRNDSRLWRTRPGSPFFERQSQRIDDADRFYGFKLRPVFVRGEGLGIAVDTSVCHVAAQPLPESINREDFDRQFKNMHCIYHYLGDQWYEIQLRHLADQDCEHYAFTANGQTHRLLDYLHQESPKPLPPEIANLSGAESVAVFLNAQNQDRAAPTTLLYPVLDSEELRGAHAATLIEPEERLGRSRASVSRYLNRLEIDGVRLLLADQGVRVRTRMFLVPDLRFGQNKTLSVRRDSASHFCQFPEWGQQRIRMLESREAGIYSNDPLARQYAILPHSVMDTYGVQLLADLDDRVRRLYAGRHGYRPEIIVYDDTGNRRLARQAEYILEAIRQVKPEPAHALVMVHDGPGREARKEDPLAAYLTRQLRDEFELYAAVIHAESTRPCYRAEKDNDGTWRYRADERRRGKLRGYLRNVALNHIFLNNGHWPFVLADPTHAETIIGLDVKNGLCGLLAISGHGTQVRFETQSIRQAEQLMPEEATHSLVEIVRSEFASQQRAIQSVTIHRDGRLFDSERRGILRAVALLKSEGMLTDTANVSVVEIGKHNMVPMRLYAELHHGNDQVRIGNPVIGTWLQTDNNEGYLATTGWPFPFHGTANPLHLQRVIGNGEMATIAEDVFSLSCLAWTQPGTCSRQPITLRMNDRLLRRDAGEFDSVAFTPAEYTIEEETG